MPNYFAISIGPIIETLMTARKTRELWASSYMFSYIMREFVKDLNEEQNGIEVLLPFTHQTEETNCFGAGLYPDFIIVKAEAGKANTIQNIILSNLQHFSERVFLDFESWKGNEFQFEDRNLADERKFTFHNPFNNINEILHFFANYFKISLTSYEVNANAELERDRNVVFSGYDRIYTLDEFPRTQTQEEPVANFEGDHPYANQTPLRIWLNRTNQTFLFKDGFNTISNGHPTKANCGMLLGDSKIVKLVCQKPRKGFDSLIQIATRELGLITGKELRYDEIIDRFINNSFVDSKEEDYAEDAIIKELKKAFPNEWKAYHKYVAIVHCDGDNVGKIVGSVGHNDSMLKQFSRALIDFASKATDEIVTSGGSPVYAGGDDLLFFAPIVFDGKTIIELLSELDCLFKTIVSDKYITSPKATLRFGVSITYYKYPLYQARNLSFNLMEQVKNEQILPGKNAINLMVQKHSGQQLPMYISKADETLWHEIIQFINKFTGRIAKGDFLNSITFKLETQRNILKDIMGERNTHFRTIRLEQFFRNNWNEVYGGNAAFFEELQKLILKMNFNFEHDAECKNENQIFGLLYGILRFVHFTNSEDKD
ncbi:MAG: hypothetical protein JPMHGGIA_01831 [Saprospiraceae bacterium]|nr:hypothetical protein [Saprospiraceae bacterium]